MSSKISQALLIEPKSHIRIFDRDFQTELYEKYHTKMISKWCHRICTPVILLMLLTMAGFPDTGLIINGTIIAAAGLQLFYLYSYGLMSLVMLPLLVIITSISLYLQNTFGMTILPILIVITLVAVNIQTFSHIVEPVPPPWSGRDSSVPYNVFIKESSAVKIILVFITTLTVFSILELWATIRIWPIQILGLLNQR